MGAGSANVPAFTTTSNPDADNASAIELLYPDHYYDVGSLGVRVKFSDAVFGNSDTFTITTSGATGAGGNVGSAKYIWGSSLGDSSKAIGISPRTTSVNGERVGSKGVTLHMSNSGALGAGDYFNIICRGPQPLDSNVTQLNFGNVTVSTNSAVHVVWFELISGASAMSTVKFSLQADGTFQHHDQDVGDTEFHFGTSGAGNNAPGTGASPVGNDQFEFSVDSDGLGNIVATDIDADVAPNYLNTTVADLPVVSSADNATAIGNFQGAVVSDFIYLAIQLGANETGANSTINYRMFFDFS
jgi:hypothetical protein